MSDSKGAVSSINVTKRTGRTWQTWLLHSILRPFNSHIGRPGKTYPEGSPKLKIPRHVSKKCNVTERRVDDIWIYDMTLKDTSARDEGGTARRPYHIYYFAGGGWQSPPSGSHWKSCLAFLQSLPGVTISIVAHPLAPASPAPKTLPHLMSLYRILLTNASKAGEIVTLMGDSSGGELALCLPLEALHQDPKAPRPHSIMSICPSADLRRDNPALQKLAKYDPVLQLRFINDTAAKWAGDWAKDDPRISPLHADYLDVFRAAGVKVDGCTGGYDLLGPDGVLLREKMGRLGVEGEWLEWDKMMHCWPLAKVYGVSPESEEAFRWIVQVLKRRWEEACEEPVTRAEGVDGEVKSEGMTASKKEPKLDGAASANGSVS